MLKDKNLNKTFKGMNFLRFQDDVVMIKKFKNTVKFPIIKKLVIYLTYSFFIFLI